MFSWYSVLCDSPCRQSDGDVGRFNLQDVLLILNDGFSYLVRLNDQIKLYKNQFQNFK